MKTLNIIEAAFRGTIEEQDDTIVWFTHVLKSVGADVAVMLRGGAVSCAVRTQDCGGLKVGTWSQTNPPRLADDIAALIRKGVPVYAVEEDIAERGIHAHELIEGLQRLGRADLPKLFADFERVWHW